MPRQSRITRIGVIVAVAILAAGCRHSAALPELVAPEERFAREFIRVLQDSGSAAILPLAVPSLRALKGFAPNMDNLRGLLASTHATLTSVQLNAWPQKDGGPKLVQVVYKVHGVGAPSELKLWIEEAAGRYLLNTILIERPNPAGAK